MDENAGNMSICGWYLDQLVCAPNMMWLTCGMEMDANGFYRKLASRLLSSTKLALAALDFPG